MVRAGARALNGPALSLVRLSRLYRSPAWPDPSEPAFVNAVALVETSLAPNVLLKRLKEIEMAFGRAPAPRNAPRPLDLDIIDYDGQVSAPDADPVLPHPRLAHRAFVLLPLRDVAEDWRCQATGKGIDALIAALPRPVEATPVAE
jgi:2-amino-4-hydroxy-6-hydroxymethyldihydropteridine diphosphokinase